MDSAPPPSPSSVNTNNYARLCRLLVVVGFQALKHTFDKIHSPAELYGDLTRSPVRSTLQTLKKNGIISKDQWRKLYPIIPSSVSSGNFDISLLMLLLKNICGLEPPATGWDSIPPAEDNSTEANIARLTYHRNKVYELHTIYSSVDDSTFNGYWEDISNVLVGLGTAAISLEEFQQLKSDTMDFELVEHYQELLKEWKKEDDNAKDTPEEEQSVKETEGDKQSGSMQCYDSPPQLSIKLLKASDVPQRKKRFSDVDLPIDILLLTVEDCEFISCFYYLDEPFKSYHHKIGHVYFGFMGNDEEKLKIALAKCPKVSSVPSGALPSIKNAINMLRPKAVFLVGACTGLSSNRTKLGDVVVSSKLTTHAFSTPVSSYIGNIIRDIGYGWKAPLENPDEREVSVHCDADILSIPQAASLGLRHEDIIQHNPSAIAVETEGEGVFAAGHDEKIEWMIVKGIAGYGDRSQSPNYEEWMSFASAMAASVVAKVLADPFVFQEWPHYNSAPHINIRVDCENSTRFGAQGEAHRETVTTGSAAARTRGESGHPPSDNEIMKLVALTALQSDAKFNQGSFLNYLQEVRKLLVIDTHEGSLIFTVQCGSLEILEELWEDHRSGHLKKMAQQYLVTDDILREFGEIEVNLATTIEDAEYEACKDFFLQQSRMLQDVEGEEEEVPSLGSSGEIEGLLLKIESDEEQDTKKDESGEMKDISTSLINRHGILQHVESEEEEEVPSSKLGSSGEIEGITGSKRKELEFAGDSPRRFETTAMDNIQFALQAIPVGTVIAIFLVNTNRILQGIELLSECLFLLNNLSNVLGKENVFVRTFFLLAYIGMIQGYQLISDHSNAIEYGKKVLDLLRESGLRYEQLIWSFKLAELCEQQSNYTETKELYIDSLRIAKQIHDKNIQGKCYQRLGVLFLSLSEYQKAEEHLQKALQIQIEIEDKSGEASSYGNLGTVFHGLGEYQKAEEYLQKALQIQIEIGDKSGEASAYGNLGTVFLGLGKYQKAKEYLQKALQIHIEVLDREGQAADYIRLGNVSLDAGDFISAKEFYDKSLSLAHEIGSPELQFYCHLQLTRLTLFSSGSILETVSSLRKSIQKSEEIRALLKVKDQFKISFLDEHVSPYKLLSYLFTNIGKFNEAICVEELARARALADMMSAQYSVEHRMSVHPHSWVEIQRTTTKEIDSACLYISYFNKNFSLWVMKSNQKPAVFRRIDVSDHFSSNGARKTVADLFGNISFRSFLLLPSQEQCEDRSLFSSNCVCLPASRLVEEDESKDQCPEPLTLAQCYNLLIDPVADLLDQPEIIIVPEGPLYRVPFAALKDKNEKYLSESFRIRIVPSLTTLKLIQDSSADYHSQTGALIVGEPGVTKVYYKGRVETLCPLPCAREEAQMIGRLLGVQPLVREHATKQAVLDDIHSVSLIHFAAHGDAERGEIALAPPRPYNGIPQENDYLLTMAEVAHVRLTAKLVVLSCCHSANGQIRSEGVVGIARAFLGAGARSVLVALWAIDDNATKQFMSRFYEHLVVGESASESLHQAMKWMRSNGFPKVVHWAPFMLIGDNVTFDFGK